MTTTEVRRSTRGGGGGATVQGWILPHLIAWVDTQGADSSEIRALPGLQRIDDPDLRVPESTTERAWAIASSVTGDEALGVHVAESIPRGALDLVEYAFRASSSMAVGLSRLARYGRVISDRVSAQMTATGDGLMLAVRDVAATPLHPSRVEFALAVAVKLARDTTGVRITPIKVCFEHPAPADTSEHRRFFQHPVQFSAGTNVVILSAADAALPLLDADEALAEILHRRLEKALAMRRSDHTCAGQVRRLLLDGFGRRTLTPSALAQRLGMSRRTLSRRLEDEGTSFRRLFDTARADLAQALLHDRSLSVGDIAYFLQYSEPAAFHRSFRRWMGQTPLDYRRNSALK
jgi:AraC-like DNA-binding protein